MGLIGVPSLPYLMFVVLLVRCKQGPPQRCRDVSEGFNVSVLFVAVTFGQNLRDNKIPQDQLWF
jgi:hypothetical protein